MLYKYKIHHFTYIRILIDVMTTWHRCNVDMLIVIFHLIGSSFIAFDFSAIDLDIINSIWAIVVPWDLL